MTAWRLDSAEAWEAHVTVMLDGLEERLRASRRHPSERG
jgi:hypothetical protein